MARNFYFHDRFSEGMAIVAKLVVDEFGEGADSRAAQTRVLDIPAGAGRLSAYLRAKGYDVISGDINSAQEGYVLADMTKTLPFQDETFDVTISMEGIEHIFEPNTLISELVRVTKKGGRIILTTPNVSCLFSRWTFFCTGNFFQFWPTQSRLNVNRDLLFDYGHVTPLTWQQMAFLFEHHGASLEKLEGNKVKRKILLPFFLPFMLIGYFWIKWIYAGELKRKQRSRVSPVNLNYYRKIAALSMSRKALLSRNIVLVLKKGL